MHIIPVGALLWTTTVLETCSPTLTSFKFLKFNFKVQTVFKWSNILKG